MKIIPQAVKVRKYPVRVEELKAFLKKSKKLTNQEIATDLDIPLTQVEHWFRRDKYFAIPDAEYWMHLKELLDITDNSFDKEIMEFKEGLGVFEKSERCYELTDICPTLTLLDGCGVKIVYEVT